MLIIWYTKFDTLCCSISAQVSPRYPHIILERSIPYIVQTSRNIIGFKVNTWKPCIFNIWLLGLRYLSYAVSSRVISPISFRTNFPRQHLIFITHLPALICIALTEIEMKFNQISLSWYVSQSRVVFFWHMLIFFSLFKSVYHNRYHNCQEHIQEIRIYFY